MTVIQFFPTFTHDDISHIHARFGSELSSGWASHWERFRPDDGMVDAIALIGHDEMGIMTITRSHEGYLSYDSQGITIAQGRTVEEALR